MFIIILIKHTLEKEQPHARMQRWKGCLEMRRPGGITKRPGTARQQPKHFHRKPTEWKTCKTGYFNLFRSNAHSIKKNSSGGCLFTF